MISIEEVRKIAKLARIKLTSEEEEYYTETISVVLDYMKILDEVNIQGVEPTYQVTGLDNIVREDRVYDCEFGEKLIEQMPKQEYNRLKVPGVFDNSDDV